MTNQPSDVLSVMPFVQPTGQATSSQHVTGATASSDVPFTWLVAQPVHSKMTLPQVSLTGTAHSEEPNSNVECYGEPTSPTMEEEGEVSDWESRKVTLSVAMRPVALLRAS